jgi:hypothetical protein
MDKQKIQEQIDKKEKEIKELKEKLKEESVKENKVEWLYIPELKIEIQKSIHHKNKSYDDLVKEFGKEYLEEHLPTYAYLQFLRNNKKYCESLGLINTWEFVQQEDEISRKNGYVAWFGAYSYGAYLYCGAYSGNSDSDLGVRFCRKKIKGTKNDILPTLKGRVFNENEHKRET